MKIVTDELSEDDLEFFSNWMSYHIESLIWMIPLESTRHEFSRLFMRTLRPELVSVLIKDKDRLFPPSIQQYINLPKEAKDG